MTLVDCLSVSERSSNVEAIDDLHEVSSDEEMEVATTLKWVQALLMEGENSLQRRAED